MKIVFESLAEKPSTKRKIVHRSARSADGKRISVRVVDADSETFGLDFLSAFNANVRRVRRKPKAEARS